MEQGAELARRQRAVLVPLRRPLVTKAGDFSR